MVAGVVAATKAASKQHSPSKVFEEIGLNEVKGYALGIKNNAGLAEKEAAKMSTDAYNAAVLWIKSYRNDTEYLASEELNMWESLGQYYAEYSKERVAIDTEAAKIRKALLKEQEQDEKAAIDAINDLYKKKSSGGVDYYSYIDYSAEIEKLKEFGDIFELEQLELQRNAKITGDKMSDAYEKTTVFIDLAKEMRDLEDSYNKTRESAVSSLTAQTGIAKGYTSALSEATDRAKTLNDTNKKLIDDLNTVAKAAGSNITLDYYEEIKANFSISDIVRQIEAETADLAEYSRDLGKAAAMGLNKSMLDELSDGSAQSAEILKKTLEGGMTAIMQLNTAAENRDKVVSELASFTADVKTGYTKGLEELNELADKAIKSGFTDALTANSAEAEKAAELLAAKTTEAMVKELANGENEIAEAADSLADALTTALDGNQNKVADAVKKMFGGVEYDPGVDYQALINEAVEAGRLTELPMLEAQRNAKIDGENLGDIWSKTFKYVTEGLAAQMDEAEQVIAGSVEKMNLAEEASDAGIETLRGYMAGLNSMRDEMEANSRRMADAIGTAYVDALSLRFDDAVVAAQNAAYRINAAMASVSDLNESGGYAYGGSGSQALDLNIEIPLDGRTIAQTVARVLWQSGSLALRNAGG
jgi:hypothetical protein